jgi:hypothetical protein
MMTRWQQKLSTTTIKVGNGINTTVQSHFPSQYPTSSSSLVASSLPPAIGGGGGSGDGYGDATTAQYPPTIPMTTTTNYYNNLYPQQQEQSRSSMSNNSNNNHNNNNNNGMSWSEQFQLQLKQAYTGQSTNHSSTYLDRSLPKEIRDAHRTMRDSRIHLQRVSSSTLNTRMTLQEDANWMNTLRQKQHQQQQQATTK